MAAPRGRVRVGQRMRSPGSPPSGVMQRRGVARGQFLSGEYQNSAGEKRTLAYGWAMKRRTSSVLKPIAIGRRAPETTATS